MNTCPWHKNIPLYESYHDSEWGVPVTNDLKWFEFILLEGAQAGLNWFTILKRRQGYASAFADFNPELVSKFSQDTVTKLMQNNGIIKNRLKINSAILNAQAFLKLQDKYGSFNAYMWEFVNNTPIINQYKEISEVPAVTKEAVFMSKSLKKEGFTFVGPTICYALMQATGMVNDHLISCFRHRECAALAAAF